VLCKGRFQARVDKSFQQTRLREKATTLGLSDTVRAAGILFNRSFVSQWIHCVNVVFIQKTRLEG
jgi:hypothetical protein